MTGSKGDVMTVRTVPTREMLMLPRWRFLAAATVAVEARGGGEPVIPLVEGSSAGCPSVSCTNASLFASS